MQWYSSGPPLTIARLEEGRPMTHDIVPLTPDLWPAFEALFAATVARLQRAVR